MCRSANSQFLMASEPEPPGSKRPDDRRPGLPRRLETLVAASYSSTLATKEGRESTDGLAVSRETVACPVQQSVPHIGLIRWSHRT